LPFLSPCCDELPDHVNNPDILAESLLRNPKQPIAILQTHTKPSVTLQAGEETDIGTGRKTLPYQPYRYQSLLQYS
jgi:hypothetical protein